MPLEGSLSTSTGTTCLMRWCLAVLRVASVTVNCVVVCGGIFCTLSGSMERPALFSTFWLKLKETGTLPTFVRRKVLRRELPTTMLPKSHR